MLNYEQAALKVLDLNQHITPEELGELVYIATKNPFTFSRDELNEMATSRRRLLELFSGYELYLAKLYELKQLRER